MKSINSSKGIYQQMNKTKSQQNWQNRKSLQIIRFKMGRVKGVSESQVAAIKALRDSAMSQKDIALQMGCFQCAMSKILAKDQSNRKNCDRKMKTTRRDERVLKRITQKVFELQRDLPTVEPIRCSGFSVHHSP